MAWNIPGGSGKDGRNPQRRGGGNAFDRVLEPLRGLFGGGSGGPGRWIAILLSGDGEPYAEDHREHDEKPAKTSLLDRLRRKDAGADAAT